MEEILSTYGGVILTGAFLLLMVGMHMKGAGCGAGHGDHRQREATGQAPPPAGSTPKETGSAVPPAPAGRPSGGCH